MKKTPAADCKPGSIEWRLTKHVGVWVSSRTWTSLKYMALREGCSYSQLASEAIAYWIAYLARIARKEEKERSPKELYQELLDAERLLHEIRVQKLARKLKKKYPTKRDIWKYALISRASWNRRYPGKPWPGAPGL